MKTLTIENVIDETTKMTCTLEEIANKYEEDKNLYSNLLDYISFCQRLRDNMVRLLELKKDKDESFKLEDKQDIYKRIDEDLNHYVYCTRNESEKMLDEDYCVFYAYCGLVEIMNMLIVNEFMNKNGEVL